VGKGALAPVPTKFFLHYDRDGGHASLCPPYNSSAQSHTGVRLSGRRGMIPDHPWDLRGADHYTTLRAPHSTLAGGP